MGELKKLQDNRSRYKATKSLKMKHKIVYELSLSYSPPKINLRDARILDDYGDESNAKRKINHNRPEDVSREDLDYYAWEYSFMQFEDLMFYFYPIALEYEKDSSIECIDSFMYSLDRHLPISKQRLSQQNILAIQEGLRWILESGETGYADWAQCPNLQTEIGI